MERPYQEANGVVYFPASYTVCNDWSRVTIKFRDRDTDTGWAKVASTGMPAGSGTTRAGIYVPDGQAHRWVAYATIKAKNGGPVLAQSPRVYFKSEPFTAN